MRSGFWVKRLALLIPTLLLVLILTFFLSRVNSGDQLDAELDFNEIRDQRHPRQRHAQYNQAFRNAGLNLPLFYFTVQPKSLGILQSIKDPRIEKAMSSWLKKYEVEKVTDQFMALMQGLDTIQSAKDYNELLRVLITPEDKLHLVSVDERFISQINQIRQFPKSTFSGWPQLRWHGLNNQFHNHISSLLTFNFGVSKTDGRQVSAKLTQALPWTIGISVLSLLLSIGVGGLLAFIYLSSSKPAARQTIDFGVFAFFAMPSFWLATLCIVFLTTDYYAQGWLNWFPSVGIYLPNTGQSLVSFLLLPITVMVLSGMAFFYLQWRDNAQEILKMNHQITARSKGLSNYQQLVRHVFPGAGYSILGLTGFFFPSLISGSVIIEVLFNIPGMGRLMFTSIMLNDWNVVLAVVFLGVLVSYVGFILADILLKGLDPRV